MDTVKILEVKENVFDANEVNARTVREQLTKEGQAGYQCNVLSRLRQDHNACENDKYVTARVQGRRVRM